MTGDALIDICGTDGMPRYQTIMRWLATNSIFREMYARARDVQADVLFDKIQQIALAPTRTTRIIKRASVDAAGNPIGNRDIETVEFDNTDRQKIQIDALKWRVAKLAPRKYGDRVAMEHSGKDGGPISFSNMTDEQLADFVARAQK